ncbi:AAA family ATPase [Ancylobacter rudongensis]|uniref:Cobaltochelatase CobS n=1 Tax=Ancylobacter rudongensis TaxID=177413 RepID=A0A1G4UQ19_9HYPH|nr:AAA family ATPase [Ancylobacter rudongensis]SCW95761.1 cobaltochelatase CobS [Ancylobacter rudongensis]
MSEAATLDAAPSAAVVPAAVNDGKITCHIDNARVHSIQRHIGDHYAAEWTIERYKQEFPGEPLLSPVAERLLQERAQERAKQQASEQVPRQPASPAAIAGLVTAATALTPKTVMLNEAFGLGNASAAMNGEGRPIPITTFTGHDRASLDYLPDLDADFVFNIDLLKKVIIGFELNIPTYLWGFHGTGKTTVLEQASARTGRPFIRVQHTINMQESEVLGQWTVKDGATHFQLGPLPMAMINGWVYCADEYDFAMPAVTALYQPVLEGKALLIKDAPPMFRRIEPHPNFRFVGTGNTNGIGDETGLYQGTLVMNAANFSRFGITEEVTYNEAKVEESILISRTKIDRATASKIVKFANDVRKLFRDGKISMTVSPRELIRAAQLGIAYGAKWQIGLELAFANRLSRVDKKAVMEFAQRIFG